MDPESQVEERDPTLGEIAETSASGLPEQNGSLLDSLVQQRDELSANREVYIAIPGYERPEMTLQAKYRLLDGEEIAQIGRKVTRQYSRKQFYERNLAASLDVMIEACEGFYVEMPDGGKIQLLLNGVPISGYTNELAEALRFENEIDAQQPARSCVLGLFANNVIAIQSHSTLLGRWMGDTSSEVSMEFLEEAGNP